MRTAAFPNKTLWDTLTERTIPRFERRDTQWKMWIGLHELEKFMAHQTHNKSGNHGIKSPSRVSVVTNQCVNCGSAFADRSTAQNHVVNSWTRATLQDRPQSHDLGTEDHTANHLQPLRARIWRNANVLRKCSPDPFAFPITDVPRESACPACSTTHTPQATLKRLT